MSFTFYLGPSGNIKITEISHGLKTRMLCYVLLTRLQHFDKALPTFSLVVLDSQIKAWQSFLIFGYMFLLPQFPKDVIIKETFDVQDI